jgi:hypothetical protein
VIIIDISTAKGIKSKYTVISLFLAKQTIGGNLVSIELNPLVARTTMKWIRGANTPITNEIKFKV